MSDTAKRRLAIDLDEIERQLQQSAPQRGGGSGNGAGAGSGDSGGQDPGGTPSGKPDPLAELARIVGQDDPFRSILSGEQAGTEPRPNDPDHDGRFFGLDGADETLSLTLGTPGLHVSSGTSNKAPVGLSSPAAVYQPRGLTTGLPSGCDMPELRAGEQPPDVLRGCIAPARTSIATDALQTAGRKCPAPISAPGSCATRRTLPAGKPSQDFGNSRIWARSNISTPNLVAPI